MSFLTLVWRLIKFSSSFCFIFHLIGLQSLTHSTHLKTRICAYIFDVSNFVLHVCLVFKRSYMRQWKRQNTSITLSKFYFLLNIRISHQIIKRRICIDGHACTNLLKKHYKILWTLCDLQCLTVCFFKKVPHK